ncbi:hypothetical protein ACIFOT_03365 [Neobacillus sp. NRS-1170]|uniref:hypothetical protein n=1 Tax=Neobacillus sp. NRS-1170 TaxID=3233898 RepID=UPI003D2BCE55
MVSAGGTAIFIKVDASSQEQEPEELANVVVFLARDTASGMVKILSIKAWWFWKSSKPPFFIKLIKFNHFIVNVQLTKHDPYV